MYVIAGATTPICEFSPCVRENGRMKRNTMVQWMNLNQNSSFVNATQLPLLYWIHTPSAIGSYDRQARLADEIMWQNLDAMFFMSILLLSTTVLNDS